MRYAVLVLVLGLLLPASAHAAFVTVGDTSVRPGEGSPWSKGTLFRGQGFQVGHTTTSGWAYGRAKGEAERCGWVLISSINSTTRTDTTCGAPRTEPLGDSAHVPGGGPSQRWYVVCSSATLHGNYGGPGQLRSPTHSLTKGAPLGWRYTTGDRYAASVDGPTGTPRFILRSCISPTPPLANLPSPGGFDATDPDGDGYPGTELIGPPPYTVLDEEALFEIFDKGDEDEVAAGRAQAAGPIIVRRTRATVRISPNNIIVANGLRGDTFTPAGDSCEGWYYGTIRRRGSRAKHVGWVQGAGLSRFPRGTRRNCARAFPYRARIGFVNAPFRSITFRTSKQKWTKTGSASQAYLTSRCPLYMNYDSSRGATDLVTGAIQRLVFKNGDDSARNDIIGYRYTTPDDAFALVSVKSGFRSGGRKVGMWAYAPRSCVQPLSSKGASKVNRIYQTEIRICDGVKPTEAARRMNRSRRADRIMRVKPCRLPNSATRPGRPRPDHPASGWNIGVLRTPR